MSAVTVRPIIEEASDSPYLEVIYTLEEGEFENVTEYLEGDLGNKAGNLSRSSNHSELASLDANGATDDIEVLAVDCDDHDDYIWVKGKFTKACIKCFNLVTGVCCFCFCFAWCHTIFKTVRCISLVLVCFLGLLVLITSDV